MPKISEFDLQRALCIWLDGNPHPQTGLPRTTPALAPGVVYWHTPNGGARAAFEAKRFKESGVKAGIPDLLFLREGRLYGLELKEPGGGRLSIAQINMRGRMLDAGAAAVVVMDDLREARAWCHANLLTISN